MDNLLRATVSVSVTGDDLDPHEVTALLGAPPKRAVRKGEVFVAIHGKPSTARTGMWNYGDGWISPPDLDRQIADLLARLTNNMMAWADVTTRYECYLEVGGTFDGWTGGITLQPITMKLLADRNLAIDFDLYAPAASD